jgi:hypothetical protein
MATSIDLRDWRKVLTPCPAVPEPVVTYVFSVNNLSEARAKITEVLGRYGMPYVFFPSDDNIITCRMRFTLDREDNTVTFVLDPDHVRIDFSQNPMQVLDSMSRKAMEIIEFAIALLREMGFINDESETKVRESMIRSWSKWIEIPKAILPIFLGKLMNNSD